MVKMFCSHIQRGALVTSIGIILNRKSLENPCFLLAFIRLERHVFISFCILSSSVTEGGARDQTPFSIDRIIYLKKTS